MPDFTEGKTEAQRSSNTAKVNEFEARQSNAVLWLSRLGVRPSLFQGFESLRQLEPSPPPTSSPALITPKAFPLSILTGISRHIHSTQHGPKWTHPLCLQMYSSSLSHASGVVVYNSPSPTSPFQVTLCHVDSPSITKLFLSTLPILLSSPRLWSRQPPASRSPQPPWFPTPTQLTPLCLVNLSKRELWWVRAPKTVLRFMN